MSHNDIMICPQCENDAELRDLWKHKGVCNYCFKENINDKKEDFMRRAIDSAIALENMYPHKIDIKLYKGLKHDKV